MNPLPNRRRVAPLMGQLAVRYRWLHAPVSLLLVFLQRTPLLRVMSQGEYVAEVCASSVVRSLFAAGALGAFNSMAGATGTTATTTTTTTTATGTTTTTTPTVSTVNFSVSGASPALGPTGTTFSLSANVGTALSAGFSLSGGITNAKSWSVSGTLPDGLSVVGGNPVNVGAPYKMTIAGTPLTTGLWSFTVTAYENTNETGNSSSLTCNISVASYAVFAPSITLQPTGASGAAGGSVSFAANASGSPAPVFTWYHDGVLVGEHSGSSLTLSDLTAADAGQYTMTATNSAGSATTTAATLTVAASALAPAITGQPQSITVNERDGAVFSVAVTGTVTLAYQWNKGGTAIPGATSSTYELPVTQPSDAGSYTVTVTNSAGSVTSAAATLSVTPIQAAPVITSPPVSASYVAGSPVNLTVSASGTAPLAYQWSKNGVPVAGATNGNYWLASVAAGDAGSYTVIISNSLGSVGSSPAVLTVTSASTAPTIVSQPTAVSVSPGASATFQVGASGGAPLSYQWLHNGAAVGGATGSVYTIGGVQAADAGSYSVLVGNATGQVTSATAALIVSSTAAAATAPQFTSQPGSDTVAVGHAVSFTAATSANPSSTYQWQVSTDNGSTWSAVSDNATYGGSTSSTLTVNGVASAMNNYRYRLVASNTAGAATTSALTLSVAAPVFPGPFGIAVDSAGDLFVSDSATNVIQFVTPAGLVGLLAGQSGQQGSADGSYANATFRQPRSVGLDGADNLYVADTGNSVIRKITPAGVVTTLAGSDTAQGYVDDTGTIAIFNSPQALAVDASGNVYVADTANSVIRRVSTAGVVTTLAGMGTAGTDDGTGTQARFNQPGGIALDSAGNLYVADTNNNTIRKVTAAGVVTTIAGVQGVAGYDDGQGSNALFNHPSGLTVASSGKVFIADTGNQTIRVLGTDGTVSTLAGLPTIAGLMDGTGSDSLFNQPESIGLDSSGNLYVTDNGNAAIRKITPAGVVTTLVLQQSASVPSIPVPSGAAAATTGAASSTGSSAGSAGTAASSGGGAVGPPMLVALAVLSAIRRRKQLCAMLRGNNRTSVMG